MEQNNFMVVKTQWNEYLVLKQNSQFNNKRCSIDEIIHSDLDWDEALEKRDHMIDNQFNYLKRKCPKYYKINTPLE